MEQRLRSPQEERRSWRSPSGRGEGESRKRGTAEDGNVSEAPVGSILSQRMWGVSAVCEEPRGRGRARQLVRDGAELQRSTSQPSPEHFPALGCQGEPPAASRAQGKRGAAAQGWDGSRQPLVLVARGSEAGVCRPALSPAALPLQAQRRLDGETPVSPGGETSGAPCAPKAAGAGGVCPSPESGRAGEGGGKGELPAA